MLLFLSFLLLVVGCEGSAQLAVTSAPAAPTIEVTEVVGETAVSPTATPRPDPFVQGTNGNPWWNDTVFYEVFVRSFYDSDGDGVGDLNGLIEKLDYINDGDPTTTDDLGATGIWLMPITVSPSYHGYDVVDYFRVDPEYGTNDDFKRLMEEAHARGIHVIIDFVMNHTSTEHPWFIESKDPDSNKRDWYVWSDEDPGFRGPWGQGVWHREAGAYYYGVFWSGMPDLNYANPDVTDAMFERVQFWMEEMEVDGFRLDAIKHIIEDGSLQENTFATHDWLEEFYTFYKEIDPNTFTVGEAWTSTEQVADYTGDEVDIAFQFDLAEDILNGANSGIPAAFYKTQQNVYDSFPLNQYATFIANHDQNRVMSQLQEDEAKARLAASMLLTAPGVPFIYYGEEIGMVGVKPDEDIRLPMQWASNSPQVGFTEGTPWRPAAADFPERSVEHQDNDPDSLLSHYRALIHLRNEHEALRVGEWTQLEANSRRLYTFLRHTENETILVIMNFNRNPVMAEDYSLEMAEGWLREGVTAVSLYGTSTTTAPDANADGSFTGYIPFDEIPPQSTHIIQLIDIE